MVQCGKVTQLSLIFVLSLFLSCYRKNEIVSDCICSTQLVIEL